MQDAAEKSEPWPLKRARVQTRCLVNRVLRLDDSIARASRNISSREHATHTRKNPDLSRDKTLLSKKTEQHPRAVHSSLPVASHKGEVGVKPAAVVVCPRVVPDVAHPRGGRRAPGYRRTPIGQRRQERKEPGQNWSAKGRVRTGSVGSVGADTAALQGHNRFDGQPAANHDRGKDRRANDIVSSVRSTGYWTTGHTAQVPRLKASRSNGNRRQKERPCVIESPSVGLA